MPLMGKELHPYFYGGKVLHSSVWANKKISELIYSDKPFMVSRFGNTELFNLNCFLEKQLLGKSPENDELTSEWWENLYTLSGFFPKDDIYQERFAKTILESARCTDILGVWNRPMEDYHLKTSMKKTSITALRWLEPWYSDTPWTHALEGKKVLVIHPFEESIRKQFAIRERIFPNGLLPDFELDVLKAVQTLGDNNDY